MRHASAQTPAPAERLAFLEGIRGVLALYVAVGHLFTMVDPSIVTGRPSIAPAWLRGLATPFLYGHVAVALFIVVSGFSLQLGLLQGGGSGEVRSLGGFFRRRALRILPAYYATLIVSTIVALTITPRYPFPPFNLYLPVNAATFTSHVFLVHNLWPGWMLKINGVLWTVAAEAQLYLAFPVLAALQRRRGRGFTLLVGAAFGLATNEILLLVDRDWGFPATYLRLWYAFLFTVGMAAVHLVYRPPLRGVRIESWIGAIGWFAFVAGTVALFTTRMYDYEASDVPFGIALACLCALGAAGGGGMVVRLLGSRPLAALGGFSYSLYLVHHPIEQIVYAMRPPSIAENGPTLAWLALVGLPLMLGVAWLFSLAFERPFMRRREARYRRSKRVVPSSLPLPGVFLPEGPLTVVEEPQADYSRTV